MYVWVMELNEKLQNTWERAAKWIVGIGALFGLICLIIFLSRYSFGWGANVDAESTSHVVTAINGIITPLWSLASVVLFYVALKVQRADFNSQLEELKSTRQEFHINRLTNILYNQLERIQKNIDEYDQSPGRLGFENLIDFSAKMEMIPETEYVKEKFPERLEAHHNAMLNNIDHLVQYVSPLRLLLTQIRDNCTAFEIVVKNSGLSDQQEKELWNLFRENLGRELIFCLNKIKAMSQAYHSGSIPATGYKMPFDEQYNLEHVFSDAQQILSIFK